MNVADRLAEAARERPDEPALVSYDDSCNPLYAASILGLSEAGKPVNAIDPNSSFSYLGVTFAYLNEDANTLARGLAAMGIGPGKRIALLVKPSVEFVTLVFALLRTGATMVLVDAGLGRKNLVRCLASTEPDGFVAIPLGQALRVLKRKHFKQAKLNVTVGRRWGWGGETLTSVRKLGREFAPTTDVAGSPSRESAIRDPQSTIAHTTADDPAAIVFTSGSTGPPKGVLYTHRTFVTQCDSIQRQYDIRPGDVDLACFPLFGLFNVACGVTTVLPEMDFSRPASCDPKKVLAAANQWKVNQAFASPAVWDRLSRHCEETGESIPTLRRVFSCGAPVPAKVLRRTLACVHPEATMHTPYGATEALPVATIEAQEILSETAAKTDEGAGVCVGRKFDVMAEAANGEPTTSVAGGFAWRVIRITDDPIPTIDQTEELPQGEIGELIVKGPQVSKRYLEPRTSVRGAHNELSKITDGDDVWHRIGDVGYFDEQERFWYCGRKSQRVVTSEGTLYTECVEGLLNTIPEVSRSALVGPREYGSAFATPVIWIEPSECFVRTNGRNTDGQAYLDLMVTVRRRAQERGLHLSDEQTFIERGFPTDIRHNSKIKRELLCAWAEGHFGWDGH